MEDFRTRLDVSKPYQMCDINKRVLKPIAKELKKDEKLNAQSLIFDVEKHTHSKRQMEMSSINKSKQIRSREKTPRWLTDPNQSKNTTDSEFEKDRERHF